MLFDRDVDEAAIACRIGEAIRAERLKQDLTQRQDGLLRLSDNVAGQCV